MNTLELLPPEILADGVLAYLSARDILRCSSVQLFRVTQFSSILFILVPYGFFQVCTYLRDVVQVSLVLQYRIELEAEGLNPSPRHEHTTNTSDRLESLLRRRKVWRTLSWERIETIELPNPCIAYEFIDGVFAKSDGRSPSEIAISTLR